MVLSSLPYGRLMYGMRLPFVILPIIIFKRNRKTEKKKKKASASGGVAGCKEATQ
jgi:hypothetical protein